MSKAQEIEAVSKLKPFDRYKYAIKKIADSEILWVLQNSNNDFAISQIDDRLLFHIWPSSELAGKYIDDEWNEYQSIKVPLDRLEKEILPLIEKESYLIDVFSVNDLSGFVVSSVEFIRDLNIELDKY